MHFTMGAVVLSSANKVKTVQHKVYILAEG